MRRRWIIATVVLGAAAACGEGDTRRDVPAAAVAESRTVSPAAGTESRLAPSTQGEDSTRRAVAAELRALSLDDLQHERATIFGRHGRVFQDPAIQQWLASQPWYRADTAFTNARLTEQERERLDLVREAEAAKHARIEPGDMRFYQTRVITSAMLGTHSPQDWEVLAAEVLANHGYVFFDEGDFEEGEGEMSWETLQKYFDERYWYRRNGRFGAEALSPIEQQNLDTITVALTRQLGRTVSPGMMHLFAHTPLTERTLENVSIADLRLLRNEVYARHGREFRTPWVRERFAREPWYKPRPDFSESELSDVERENVALITRREAALHEELGTRLLTVRELRGLPPEDARRLRNEVYARHGRRFRDPGLQRYFAGFAWYKANDAFRESDLNVTERKNVDLISQYESGKFTEG